MLSLKIMLAAMLPIWPKGAETELNSHYAFEAEFGKGSGGHALTVVAPYPYKAYLNGVFVGAGPARASRGYYRPDRWTLPVSGSGNRVRIEICAYNQGACYCNADNPAFLMAEVTDGTRTLAETGRDFKACRVPRVRKVSRYSMQRTFGECWKTGGDDAPEYVETAVQDVKPRLLPRRAVPPTYALGKVFRRLSEYPVRYAAEKEVRSIDFIEGKVDSDPSYYRGARLFAKDELEVNLWDEMQRLVSDPKGTDGRAVVFDCASLQTGFLRFTVNCSRPGRLYALFDEILTRNGDVDPARLKAANAVRWDIVRPGRYELETFEPYAMRGVRFVMLGGEAEIEEPRLRLVRSPSADARRFAGEDRDLETIFEAARETFAQNAVDVFTDCPGRERAGWLCDSWFMARASRFFTGSIELESLFLENFLHAENGSSLPKGIFPNYCPSSVPGGRYIPNWSFWLVLQLGDYLQRGGDRALIDAFRPKMEELVGFFARYENSDGLLERLPGWVFVEWSKANELVQDVSYPSNMTYAKVLETLAGLYGRPELAEKAKRVREAVLRQSWNGTWFCDNAVRKEDGTLVPSGKCTEVCQYYAFFFGIASRSSHPELWRKLVSDFGPGRKRTGKWPEIAPANAFIGNYLRLELLTEAGLHGQVRDEICGYFLPMAQTTGTLWEYDAPTASCCHGFASYIAVLIDRVANRPFPVFSKPRAVTGGPHDHFLANYYGINAWSPDNRYLLVLETDIKNRLPDGEACTLGLVDLEDGNRFIPVTTTRCWNFQEATMAHWMPCEKDTFVFNDMRDGRFCAVVMNWKTKRERVYPFPVSAVTEDGRWGLSVNYARLFMTRPDYGYFGNGQDGREGVKFPEDDGLWRIDLLTGKAELIVSCADVRDRVPEVTSDAGMSYICHTVISKDNRRVYFLSRSVEKSMAGTKKWSGPKWQTTAFTCNADGTGLRRCFPDGWGSSHFNWKPAFSERDARTMAVTCFWQNKVYTHVEFTVGEEPFARQIGGPVMNFDGHCLYSPDGRFMSGDGYWDRNYLRHWKMVRLSDFSIIDLGSFYIPEVYRNTYTRCDLHPRWRPDGRQIGFNSVHEGSRQVYVMDVSGIDVGRNR